MEIKLRKYRDIFVLDLIGEFDIYNTGKLSEAVARLRGLSARGFIINLPNISYIDSSGIGTLIKLQNGCREKKEEFYLTDLSENIHKIVSESGLENFFAIRPDIRTAIMEVLTLNREKK